MFYSFEERAREKEREYLMKVSVFTSLEKCKKTSLI